MMKKYKELIDVSIKTMKTSKSGWFLEVFSLDFEFHY